MSSKRNKILQNLIKCITHDFGFYNPIWKWSSLPKDISENYTLIENDLKIWEEKGYIKILEKDNIKYIEIKEIPKLE